MDTKQITLPTWLQRANQLSYVVGLSGLALWIAGLFFPPFTTLSTLGNYMLSAGLVGILVFVIILSNKHRSDALLASLPHDPCPKWLQPILYACYGLSAVLFASDIFELFTPSYSPSLWAELVFMVSFATLWILEKEKRYHLEQAHRALSAE